MDSDFSQFYSVVYLWRTFIQTISSQSKNVWCHVLDTIWELKEKALAVYRRASFDDVNTWFSDNATVIQDASFLVAIIFLSVGILKVIAKKRVKKEPVSSLTAPESASYRWSVFDLAKTAYEPGHTEAVINIVEKLHYDVNSVIPSNGLSLFMCACLSGKRELINYLLSKGANIHLTTIQGDSALYLATFGVLSSADPDIRVLEDLITAGCSVNESNSSGYAPLHRAASSGNEAVIKTLLKHGADPYQASQSGIYPIDCAINAGNLEAAELLKMNLANPHVWDVVDPHTPLHIKMGLQSPQRKHLMESSQRITSPRVAAMYTSPRVAAM